MPDREEYLRRVSLCGLIALCVWSADWAIKASHPWLWGGWIPHATSRPLWLVIPLVICAAFVLYSIPGRFIMICTGLLIGGYTANMIDLQIDGFVWNCFPVPFTDLWCNLADIAIMLGVIGCMTMAIRIMTRELKHKRSLSRPESVLDTE